MKSVKSVNTVDTVDYRKLVIRSGEHYFTLFCTQKSLKHRWPEVMLCAEELARRLRWSTYDTTILPATTAEAMERDYALFENRYPG